LIEGIRVVGENVGVVGRIVTGSGVDFFIGLSDGVELG
jgi:hypothetical protein